METVKDLELSIHALIEAEEKLQKERDRAYKETEQAQKKLEEAREKIKNLQMDFKKSGNDSNNRIEFEEKRKKVINHIQTILSRLNQNKK